MQLHKNVLLLAIILLLPLHAHSHNPDDGWIITGKSYMTQWDFNQAIFYFSKAIENDPNHTKAYLYRSRAYLMVNRYQEAMDDYQKALTIDPKFVKNFMGKKRLEKNNSRYFTSSEFNPLLN